MNYDKIETPDNVEIRTPKNEDYRTCSECGGDCEPDTGFSADVTGVRIAFVCPQHGVQSIVDPFADKR